MAEKIPDDGEPCALCGRKMNQVAADPSLWPCTVPSNDGSGIPLKACMKCVGERVHCYTALRAERDRVLANCRHGLELLGEPETTDPSFALATLAPAVKHVAKLKQAELEERVGLLERLLKEVSPAIVSGHDFTVLFAHTMEGETECPCRQCKGAREKQALLIRVNGALGVKNDHA